MKKLQAAALAATQQTRKKHEKHKKKKTREIHKTNVWRRLDHIATWYIRNWKLPTLLIVGYCCIGADLSCICMKGYHRHCWCSRSNTSLLACEQQQQQQQQQLKMKFEALPPFLRPLVSVLYFPRRRFFLSLRHTRFYGDFFTIWPIDRVTKWQLYEWEIVITKRCGEGVST